MVKGLSEVARRRCGGSCLGTGGDGDDLSGGVRLR